MTEHEHSRPIEAPRLDPRDERLGQALAAGRAAPAPGFRGALGRRLVGADPGYGPRPERLRTMVAALVGTGGLLIALGVLQSLGVL